jgi:hypothetical protein
MNIIQWGERKKANSVREEAFLREAEAKLTKGLLCLLGFLFNTRYTFKNHIYPTEGEGGYQ